MTNIIKMRNAKFLYLYRYFTTKPNIIIYECIYKTVFQTVERTEMKSEEI